MLTIQFLLQLISAFIVGGILVNLLTTLAEKVPQKISGIILGLPTTVILGFFFLGWNNSPEIIKEVAPASIIPLGISVCYCIVYAYVARFSEKIFRKKVPQIIFSLIVSILFWLTLAIPIITQQINDFFSSLFGYLVLISFAHIIIHTNKIPTKIPVLSYTNSQKIYRSIFVGFIIMLVVFLGKVLNPFWGSAFTMFPAAYTATLVIFHWYYPPQNIFAIIKNIAPGSISLISYILASMIAFPLYGLIWGTIIALITSIITTILIIKIQQIFHKKP